MDTSSSGSVGFRAITGSLAETLRKSDTPSVRGASPRDDSEMQYVVQAKSAPQFRLLILGDGSVRTVPLEGSRWIIGRAHECTIPLRDPTVSRKHLLLERVGDDFRFQDLGGANPAQVDGRPVRQGTLAVGQALRIGLTQLVIERRHRPAPLAKHAGATVVLSREVLDEDAAAESNRSLPSVAARVLQRIEWTFADLGDLADAAEPMLELALSLTGRRAGWIARFDERGGAETLAAIGIPGDEQPQLAEGVLLEAQRIGQPHLVTVSDGDVRRERLLIPLGKDPGGLMVLDAPTADAASGQELLRLAESLGSVVWHRLQETLERQRLRQELQRLRFHGTTAHNMLLASQRLQPIREQLRGLAGGDEAVLLAGEAGTEREELARYLHAESPRRTGPIVAWDAAAVPADRHAAELPDLLQRAGGGTLFVDNVTALSAALQDRLAHAAAETTRDAARIVVGASDLPPPGDTGDGSSPWTGPLRDRTASARVSIPPLREHPHDVLPLAELFLSALGSCPDGSPRLLSERTKRLLLAYPWPGNTRELRLVIEAAAGQAGNQPIAPRHLPQALADESGDSASPLPSLEDVEREHIRNVMRYTAGVRSRAAQVLGIATSTLYEKLKKYGIE